MRDEVDEDQDAVYFAWDSNWRMAEIYQSAKEVLEEYENPEEEKAEQVQVLEQLWQRGFPWPPISWANAGGTGGAFSPMTSRRNCGSGGRLTQDMTSPNTRWGSFLQRPKSNG